MLWKIEQFIFCERQQTLSLNEQILGNGAIGNKEQAQQLEPMVAELLAYFCRNSNKTLSRDQLIEHVWAGRVVSDNAVTRVITKLRRCLDDNPKSPKFITTYPKKGYRFIASVSERSKQSPEQSSELSSEQVKLSKASYRSGSHQLVSNPLKSILIGIGLLLLVFFALLSYPVWMHNNLQPTFSDVNAITRDPGRESRPAISPNGKYLAYSEVRDSKMRLWVKSLIDETTIEINHGADKTTWVDSASWNSDGSQFVYLVTTPDTCQYFIRDFQQLEVSAPKLIHNCPAGSYGKIAFTHSDHRLVYAESPERGKPFELFELNLKTSKKRRLNQPELFLGGNSQFDLHPSTNTLLVSSPNAQQWEGFYSLNLETNELNLLFEQDAYICCGRWDHSGKRVILMGDHPATKLVSFDLNGKDSQVIYSSSDQVRVPERHPNGKDYIFPIVQVNQNSNYYDFESKQITTIANSSVDDRLPTIASHDELIAYIGLSSGSEEIWLTNFKGKWKSKLTSFNGVHHYIDLGWSYDGNYLFALTLNEIHLVDVRTALKKVLKLPQVEIRGVSWKNNQTLSFSLKTAEGWRVHYYDLATDSMIQDQEQWQYILYTYNEEDIIWQKAKTEPNQNSLRYVGKDKKTIVNQELNAKELVIGRQFNLRKKADVWVWSEYKDGRIKLMTKKGLNSTSNALLTTDHFHFDLSNRGIVYQTSASLKSDLYMTVRE